MWPWTLIDEIEKFWAGFWTALNSVCGHLNYFSYSLLATSDEVAFSAVLKWPCDFYLASFSLEWSNWNGQIHLFIFSNKTIWKDHVTLSLRVSDQPSEALDRKRMIYFHKYAAKVSSICGSFGSTSFKEIYHKLWVIIHLL